MDAALSAKLAREAEKVSREADDLHAKALNSLTVSGTSFAQVYATLALQLELRVARIENLILEG